MNLKDKVLLLFCLCCLYASAQNEDSTVKVDTIKKVVEVIKYEYYDPEPYHLKIGVGINIDNIHFKSDLYNEKEFQLGIPLAIQLAKGHFFWETGVSIQNFKFKKELTREVEVNESYIVTETVVVDTIYRYVDGTLESEIITKEVEVTKYKTTYEDEIYSKEFNYSAYTVPFIVGYQFYLNKFTAQIGVGAALNFYTSKARKQLKSDFPNEKSYFATGVVNLGLNYQLTDKISLLCHVSSLRKLNAEVYDYQTNQVSFRIFYQLF